MYRPIYSYNYPETRHGRSFQNSSSDISNIYRFSFHNDTIHHSRYQSRYLLYHLQIKTLQYSLEKHLRYYLHHKPKKYHHFPDTQKVPLPWQTEYVDHSLPIFVIYLYLTILHFLSYELLQFVYPIHSTHYKFQSIIYGKNPPLHKICCYWTTDPGNKDSIYK